MAEILKSNYPLLKHRCRECGKLEGDDGDDFIHTLDEIMDLSIEEQNACEWFADRVDDSAFPDISHMNGIYSREEIIHIFILENLIEKLLMRKPICETCFSRKKSEKALS